MFVLPALFHLRLVCNGKQVGPSRTSVYADSTAASPSRRNLALNTCFNCLVVVFGVGFAFFGTKNAAEDMIESQSVL